MLKDKALEHDSMEEAIKQYGNQIVDGIRVTRNGSFVLDQSNLDPRNIQIN